MWDYTAFLKSVLKPKAVKKAGKAVIRRVCLTSIKLRTGGGLSAGDPVTCTQPSSMLPAVLSPTQNIQSPKSLTLRRFRRNMLETTSKKNEMHSKKGSKTP